MDSPAKAQQETSANLSDMIAETFDQMESEGAEDEELEISAEDEAEDSEEATGEDGEQEVAEGEQEEASEELKEEIQDAADSDYNEPAPERWPDEIKAVYNALPPQARKAMLDGVYKPMQRSYTAATQELKAAREQINPVLEAMSQYSHEFERTGVSPQEAFKTQLAWAAHFNRVGPEQGIADMQAAYGVGRQSVGQGEQYLTPAERDIKRQIDALQQQIQGQQRYQQTSLEQQRAEALRNEIQKNLTNFVNEKTESGEPKHPHVEKVASNIAGIIRGGLIPKADEYGNPIPIRDQLARAYSMACNLDPSIRTPATDTRQAGRVKAAQKVSVVTKRPAKHTDSEEMNLTDFIEKTYDRMASRGS
jgi:hypothetical protein